MPTTAEVAAEFAELAVRNISTEFPHATQHLVRGADDASRPSQLHPAFHGSWDWHSCVHMHWLLVRLLTDQPDRLDAAAVVSTVDSTLTESALRAESWYLRENPWFERPYGWAWTVALAAACAACPHPAAVGWSAALTPLVDTVEELTRGWLDGLAGPIRYGIHANTAFALTLLIDAADALGRQPLAARCRRRAEDFFGADRDYPAGWEPSGQDFLSPALCEADLMRRVLPGSTFRLWLNGFLPGLADSEPPSLFAPAAVVDPTDGHQGHLFGLNLSRSWQFRSLLAALPGDDRRAEVLSAGADRHLAAGLSAVSGQGFVHEHWLATFAYLALSVQ